MNTFSLDTRWHNNIYTYAQITDNRYVSTCVSCCLLTKFCAVLLLRRFSPKRLRFQNEENIFTKEIFYGKVKLLLLKMKCYVQNILNERCVEVYSHSNTNPE